MMITGGANIAPAQPSVRPYAAAAVQPPALPQQQAAAKEDAARRFDRVELSESGTGNVQKDLKARLSQEARTSVSTDMIAALRSEIQNGTYRVDPREIAERMLLAGGAVR